jgi:serine-type D-Ala-D-Ala carboxypeptidase (penicillin-binding protein 5/6)
MTAEVVLEDHPLAAGADGPLVPVSAAAIAAYQAEQADQQSTVPLAAGENLTERQALEGLLVASGNDMAGLLAEWDAGSTAAFVAKMNARAHTLGLRATTFTDPSGLDARTVSTPTDLITLGHAAMADATFAELVAMPQVTLPLAGTVYNPNADVGHGAMVVIKTGADTAAGGCFLFEARTSVNGVGVTLDGVVLGQQTAHPTAAALAVVAALVKAALASIGPVPVVRLGQALEQISASWGSSVLIIGEVSNVFGWPGMTVPVRVRVGKLPTAIPAGTRIGVLSVDVGGKSVDVVLRAAQALAGPSATWRFTR